MGARAREGLENRSLVCSAVLCSILLRGRERGLIGLSPCSGGQSRGRAWPHGFEGLDAVLWQCPTASKADSAVSMAGLAASQVLRRQLRCSRTTTCAFPMLVSARSKPERTSFFFPVELVPGARRSPGLPRTEGAWRHEHRHSIVDRDERPYRRSGDDCAGLVELTIRRDVLEMRAASGRMGACGPRAANAFLLVPFGPCHS